MQGGFEASRMKLNIYEEANILAKQLTVSSQNFCCKFAKQMSKIFVANNERKKLRSKKSNLCIMYLPI